MSRRRKDPLREFSVEEQSDLASISRARSAPAEAVIRAKILLGVAAGMSYQEAARTAGRKSGDAVSALVSRFNQEGLDALLPRHSRKSGFQTEYGPEAKARILREFRREPDPERDGTTSWSLTTLERALRQAEYGLPQISTDTILNTLHEAGYRWQRNRSWSQTGQAVRTRQSGQVIVTDPDTDAKKRGLSGLTSSARKWAWRCGAKMRRGRVARCPIRATAGSPKANRPNCLMSISAKEPPR